MTIREALKNGTNKLKDAGIETPAADAGVLLCCALGCGRAYLYAHGEECLNGDRLKAYSEMLEKRSEGMPAQYVTGRCEFMALDFEVRPGVLIPRQDTEILVEYVIGYCSELGRQTKILDIGTGSGCIAVSMAHYVNNCNVTAVDISQKAIDIAGKNAVNQNVSERVEFIRGSLFEGLNGRRFDVIVSNPPYVAREDIGGLQREVRLFEPVEALDGGEDGLDFYRSISEGAGKFLTASGLLAVEVGMGQADGVKGLLEADFQDFHILRDLSGIDRVVTGRLKA